MNLGCIIEVNSNERSREDDFGASDSELAFLTRSSVATGYQPFSTGGLAMEKMRPSTEQLTMRESRVQINISKVDERMQMGSARSTRDSPKERLTEINA